MGIILSVSVPRQVNHAILAATVALGGGAMIGLTVLGLALHDPQRRAASLVFGLCLLICSCCSYLYNMLETTWRPLLRRLDHSAIFLLIAGTYTPFVITGVRGPLGLSMLEWVWGLALVGIALKLVLHGRFDRLFVALYLALGWLFVFEFHQFVAINSPASLTLLGIGGIAYTLGAVVYVRGIGPWTDAVWHGAVFAGSLSHLMAVIALRLAPPMM